MMLLYRVLLILKIATLGLMFYYLLAGIKIILLQVQKLKEKAIEIRRKSKLKLPDSIVCSTAIYLGLPLLSADQALKKVKELDLLLLTL